MKKPKPDPSAAAAFRFQAGVPCACTAMAGDAENDMLFAENSGLIDILYRPSERKKRRQNMPIM